MKSFALFSSKFLKIFNMLAKDLGALYLSNSGDSPCCPPPEPHSAGPSIRGHTEGPQKITRPRSGHQSAAHGDDWPTPSHCTPVCYLSLRSLPQISYQLGSRQCLQMREPFTKMS